MRGIYVQQQFMHFLTDCGLINFYNYVNFYFVNQNFIFVTLFYLVTIFYLLSDRVQLKLLAFTFFLYVMSIKSFAMYVCML